MRLSSKRGQCCKPHKRVFCYINWQLYDVTFYNKKASPKIQFNIDFKRQQHQVTDLKIGKVQIWANFHRKIFSQMILAVKPHNQL